MPHQLQALALVVALRVMMFLRQSRVVVQQLLRRPQRRLLQQQVRHNVLLHRGQLPEPEMKLLRCQRFVKRQVPTWWLVKPLVLMFSALSKLTMQMSMSLDFASRKNSKHKKDSASPTYRLSRVQLLMHCQTSHT